MPASDLLSAEFGKAALKEQRLRVLSESLLVLRQGRDLGQPRVVCTGNGPIISLCLVPEFQRKREVGTYGMGIGELVAKPADRSPASVGGVVYPAGLAILVVVAA